MTTLDPKLKQAAKIAAERTGLPERFLAAWFVSENGWTCPANYNFGNISYQERGIPSGGVFEGVTRVEANKVCVYGTLEEGINAFVLLLETPVKDKVLTIDLSHLKACGTDVHKMCELVGASNWASSHYNDGNGEGSLIWDVFNSVGMVNEYKEAAAAKPVTETTSHPAVKSFTRKSFYIQKGDTLSRLALDHQVPLHALQIVNGIEDPDKIEAGESLELPVFYIVKPGDTLSQIAARHGVTVAEIAKVNRIPDVDEIPVGLKIWF